jgi:CRISPR-associated protein Cmr4
MTTEILGPLAETYIHPGTGQAAGAIDLPVARERTTQYPFIPGSSMKGALLDAARGDGLDKDRLFRLFGKQENAGELLVSDARLLLLPVRSLTSPYVWLTCPYLVERFRRDMQRAGKGKVAAASGVEPSADSQALASGDGELFLEERLFSIERPPPEDLVQAISALIAHSAALARLGKQLAVISDKAFSWFSQSALPVQARNVLDEATKTSKNLWYEEALPPDTLMYFVLGERADGAAATLAAHLAERHYLQAGGNETVGQGWFAIRRVDGASP